MIEKLACSLGRNDEEPNIELAKLLILNNDSVGIKEIVDGLYNKNKSIANDCIKVLYEIGNVKPVLITEYVTVFLSLLQSKNNRLVWGGMTALATIADQKPKEIYAQLEQIKKAYVSGSVITIDQCMTVLAKLSNADKEYEKVIFPMLIKHLLHCRPKEVPQHAERISICLNKDNVSEFIKVMAQRREHLTDTQNKRIEKIIKQLKKEGLL